MQANRFRKTEHGVEWFCNCSCVRPSGWHRADHLLSGSVVRCEWCGREATRQARLIGMADLTCGRLTVIKRKCDDWGGGVNVQWFCQCACGNEQLVPIDGAKLRNGHTQSCGCISSGWDSASRFLEDRAYASRLTYFYFVDVRHRFQKFGIAKQPLQRSRDAY